MMRNWQLPVGLISVLMGFLLTVQLKNQISYREAVPSRRIEDLVLMLKNAESARDGLAKEVATLREEAAKGASSKRTDRTDISTGVVPLKGPGLEVTITDTAKPLTKGEDPNVAIVHNDDLLRLVNELKAGGAEAVCINDQRLVDTSEISCAGSTILVNQTRLAPPFVVRAIGNPDTMTAALRLRGGIIDYLQLYGIQVSIARKTEVLIPMYSGGAQYRFAKPAQPVEARS